MASQMWDYLMVAVGGAIGSLARYWLGGLVAARLGVRFPYGTLLINVTGSFLIGYFLTVATERLSLHPAYRLLIAVGFLGGYTTFSAFEYETLRLLEAGGLARALANVVLSVTVGLAACWGGALLARSVPLSLRSAALEPAHVTRAAVAVAEGASRPAGVRSPGVAVGAEPGPE